MKSITRCILLLPLGIMLLFAVGESAGGDLIGGLSHVVQTIPLVLLAVLAWFMPRIGGALLLGVGLLLGVLYLVSAPDSLNLRITIGAILFGPAIISGILFIASTTRIGSNSRLGPQ